MGVPRLEIRIMKGSGPRFILLQFNFIQSNPEPTNQHLCIPVNLHTCKAMLPAVCVSIIYFCKSCCMLVGKAATALFIPGSR
jgi:hypothetical protein